MKINKCYCGYKPKLDKVKHSSQYEYSYFCPNCFMDCGAYFITKIEAKNNWNSIIKN